MAAGATKRLGWRSLFWAIGCACSLIALDVFFYPVVWLLGPVQGQVVNATTKMPVYDAVAAATWQLEALSMAGVLDVQESKTDSTGHFKIGSWHLAWRFSPVHVADHAPTIWIFRRGYVPYRAENDCCGYTKARFRIRTPFLVAQIEPAPPSDTDYGRAVAEWTQRLVSALAVEPRCTWSRLADLIEAVEPVQQVLRDKSIPAGMGFPEYGDSCTSAPLT